MARAFANTSGLNKLFNSLLFLIKPKEFWLLVHVPYKPTPVLDQKQLSLSREMYFVSSFDLCTQNKREWQTHFYADGFLPTSRVSLVSINQLLKAISLRTELNNIFGGDRETHAHKNHYRANKNLFEKQTSRKNIQESY